MIPRYDVAIATHNPKTLYVAIALLEQLKIRFVIRAPEELKDGIAGVIVTTFDDMTKLSHIIESKIILFEDTMDSEEAIIRIMFDLLDIALPTHCIIGIDPGMRFGVAIVVDGQRVHSKTCSTPHGSVHSIHEWASIILSICAESSVSIRIGTGSRLYEVLLLRSLRDTDSTISVELVDERNTTVRGQSDQSSAVLIACRKGRKPIQSDYNLDPKDGYIRSLIQLVSRMSDGEMTMTKDEARSVLLDDVSLESFLANQS